MDHKRLFALAAVVGAIGFGLAAAPQADPRPGPMLYAHADLERVFNEINPKSEAEVTLEQLRQEFQKRKDTLRGEAETLKQDLDLLVPGTEAHEKAERKYRDAAIAYSAFVEYSKAKLEKERAVARRSIFEHILRSAQAFAQANGIANILSDDSRRAVEEGTELQIVQQMAFRRLIYSDESFDVTDDLIEWINSGK